MGDGFHQSSKKLFKEGLRFIYNVVTSYAKASMLLQYWRVQFWFAHGLFVQTGKINKTGNTRKHFLVFFNAFDSPVL